MLTFTFENLQLNRLRSWENVCNFTVIFWGALFSSRALAVAGSQPCLW
jgi:hypothetical protein